MSGIKLVKAFVHSKIDNNNFEPDDNLLGCCAEIYMTLKHNLVFQCLWCYNSLYCTFTELLDHITLQHNFDRMSKIEEVFMNEELKAANGNTDCEASAAKDEDVIQKVEYGYSVFLGEGIDDERAEFRESKCNQDTIQETFGKTLEEMPHCEDKSGYEDKQIKPSTYPNDGIPNNFKITGFTCEVCGFTFGTKRVLSIHKKKNHTTEELRQCIELTGQWIGYKCVVCYRTFGSTRNLSNHEKKTHTLEELQRCKETEQISNEGNVYKCVACYRIFGNKRNVAIHNKRMHSIKELREAMDKMCKREMTESMASHEGNLPNAESSDSASGAIYKTSIQRPFIVMKGVNLLKCEKCDRVFETRAKLSFHARYHYDHKYQCEICGAAFTFPSWLDEHMRRHSDVKNFACSRCPKKFHTNNTLQRHERTHDKGRKFQCDMCSSAFVDKANLYVHRRRHLGIKKFACSLCPSKFCSSTELKSHERYHKGTREFHCKECGKDFITSYCLSKHKKIRHSNIRPHKCQFCEKEFSTTGLLRKHSVVHKKERDVTCDCCDARFKERKCFLLHRKRLHSDAPIYRCRICRKIFVQETEHTSHMNNVHNVE